MIRFESVSRIAELVERDAWLDLFGAAPEHVRENLGLRSSICGGMALLACRSIPIIELNRAMAVGVEQVPSRRDVDTAIAWLDTHAASWALQVAPIANASPLRNYLEDTGLMPSGSGWAKFIKTNESSPPDLRGTTVLVETVTATKAAIFGRTVADGFGLPGDFATWFAALVDRPFWSCFLAKVDGEPAGGGAMFVNNGAAWLGMQSTLPAYRERGAQLKLVVHQLRSSIAMGTRVQTCETAQPTEPNNPGYSSYRNQERAGFTLAYTRANLQEKATNG